MRQRSCAKVGSQNGNLRALEASCIPVCWFPCRSKRFGGLSRALLPRAGAQCKGPKGCKPLASLSHAQAALAAGAKEVTLLTAASDTFAQKNTSLEPLGPFKGGSLVDAWL